MNQSTGSRFFLLFLGLLLNPVPRYCEQFIPLENCQIVQDTSQCFNLLPKEKTIVGKNVRTLNGQYRVCLPVDTIRKDASDIRVILMLDNSGSMCEMPSECCGTGDGTLNCENNDPQNKRIEAAHLFIEQLRIKSPMSEVGIVVYSDKVRSYLKPVPLNDPDSVFAVHSAINKGACGGADCGEPCNFPSSEEIIEKMLPLPKIAATHPGLCLDSALSFIDMNYENLSPTMERHIILLTDGAWDDIETRSPSILINSYHEKYPDRPLPKVHGVFISDSASHVAHDYPACGCSGGNDVDLSSLESISKETNGLYFPGTTPQTIAQKFLTLLSEIVIERQRSLTHVEIFEIETSILHSCSSITTVNVSDYMVKTPDIDLRIGENRFEIRQIVQLSNTEKDTLRDTFTIIKTENYDTFQDHGIFAIDCSIKMSELSIKCTPQTQTVNQNILVEASIPSADRDLFVPESLTAHGIIRFPDNEQNTIALFHLDGDIINYGVEAVQVTGNPELSNTETAFGSGAIKNDSFTIHFTPISDNFSIELWIKPENRAATWLQNDSFSLGMNGSGHLITSLRDTTVYCSTAIDIGSWSHVALCRLQGELYLFINGVLMSQINAFEGIVNGTLLINASGNSILDELRISSVSRIQKNGTASILEMPVTDDILWTAGDKNINSSQITLSGLWSLGETRFMISSAEERTMFLNLKHTGQPHLSWSKMSDPVTFIENKILCVAQLFDSNGEGHIDRINLVCSKSINASDPNILNSVIESIIMTSLEDVQIELHVKSTNLTDTNILELTLFENIGPDLETGWNKVDFITNGKLFIDRIEDKAGPVIKKAIFNPGKPGSRSDTMHLIFSEPVNCSQLFNLSPSDQYNYYNFANLNNLLLSGAHYSSNQDTQFKLDATLIITSGYPVIPDNDSIQLCLGTTDVTGNEPPINGRRGPIEWGRGNEIILIPSANPFIPGTTVISESFKRNFGLNQNTGSYGILIGVASRKPLLQQRDGFFGSGKIYDAVGNVVSKLNIYQVKDSRNYGIYWDGKNRVGRTVGIGTYLIVIKATDIENFEFTGTLKLGVDR